MIRPQSKFLSFTWLVFLWWDLCSSYGFPLWAKSSLFLQGSWDHHYQENNPCLPPGIILLIFFRSLKWNILNEMNAVQLIKSNTTMHSVEFLLGICGVSSYTFHFCWALHFVFCRILYCPKIRYHTWTYNNLIHHSEKITEWPLCDTAWASLRLKSPATQIFVQRFVQANIKQNIKALHYWPFVCGIHWWPELFLPTKGQ